MGGDDYRPPPPKPEPAQTELQTWAIVEIFGHQKYAGFIQTLPLGGTVFIRLDVPELPERVRQLETPTYVEKEDGQRFYAPAGTEIKSGRVEGFSKIFGPAAIYCITPCTEEAAYRAIEQMSTRPLMLVKLPGAQAALPVPVPLAAERGPMAQYDLED